MSNGDTKDASVVLLMNGDKILAVSRKDDHTAFGLIGGSRRINETFEDCAIRECQEETGLRIHDPKQIFEREDNGHKVKTFTADKYYGKIASTEKGKVEWVDMKVLLDGPFGEYNLNLFKHLGMIK